MKKVLLIIFAILITVTVVSGQTCDCADLQDQIEELAVQVEIMTEMLSLQEMGMVKPVEGSAVLKFGALDQIVFGDFTIDFYNSAQYKTAADKDVLVVKALFKNNSSETVSFASQIAVKASQNGIGLIGYKTDDSSMIELSEDKAAVVTIAYRINSLDYPVNLVFTTRRPSDAEPAVWVITLTE